jgi:hypothetical protein
MNWKKIRVDLELLNSKINPLGWAYVSKNMKLFWGYIVVDQLMESL